MNKRVFFDGLNLLLARGTGIATYTRILAQLVREQGGQIGIIQSTPAVPVKRSTLRRWYEDGVDEFRCQFFGLHAAPMASVNEDLVFASRNLFKNARRYFGRTGRFVDVTFDQPPDILHCTYPIPIRCRRAVNICTIHDLVPLRLPSSTTDDRREMLTLLRGVARTVDHIVTVSECSKRDIIELLEVDESRVTNTYQAVSMPLQWANRPEAEISQQLAELGLDYQEYLLFFGALEPKKNVRRLIEAYLRSSADIPLVLVVSGGWHNEAETRLLEELAQNAATPHGRRVIRLDHVAYEILISLIRGARAVVFPSLYEGFGLPILEAMMLGTPVITSNVSSLPEIAGDAAVTVDPYAVGEIASAITMVVADEGLRAELAIRGKARAALFSLDRYRQTIGTLYGRLS